MAMAAMRQGFSSMVRLDQLWWWLALVSVLAILGQEVARTSAMTPLGGSAADSFDGFDDLDDEEAAADAPVITPPPVVRPPGFENERGPPSTEAPATPASPKLEAPEPPVKTRTPQVYWDEDEFEGVPAEVTTEVDAGSETPDATTTTATTAASKAPVPSGPRNYYVEMVSVAFLVAYVVKYFLGKKENERIALAWAREYCGKGSIFEKNFSLLGSGEGEGEEVVRLMKEAQNFFKFYASGRRFCQGMLATMDLKNRHDLIACLWNLVVRRRDELTIDVFMNDDTMDSVVMAVAKKKVAKVMNKDWPDLQQFATILSPPTQRRWVPEELSVISETREVASDLLTDAVLEQVFGDKFFDKYGSNFVSMHFSDVFPSGSHKKVLQFKFILPAENRMSEISRLIQAVPYFIDVVGRYKPSAQARAKGEAARKKMAEEAMKEARHEALARKREELDAKLTPEALRKKEEKERIKQLKKSMPRMRVSRAH